MLQVDTSKDKVQGQRWDYCWQRNTLQVPEHKFWHQNIALHCTALRCVLCRFVYIALVSFSLLQTFSVHLTMLFWVQTFVTSSGSAEGCLFSCVDVFSDTLNMSPVLRPQTQGATQKLARSTAHSSVVLQTQLLRSYDLCHSYLLFMYFINLSLFWRGAVILYCIC